MLTLRENETATVCLEGLCVRVRVLQLRRVWGRIDAMISPYDWDASGTGNWKWIDARRLAAVSDNLLDAMESV